MKLHICFFSLLGFVIFLHLFLFAIIDLNEVTDDETLTIHKQVRKHAGHDAHEEKRKSLIPNDEQQSKVFSSSSSTTNEASANSKNNITTKNNENQTKEDEEINFRPLSIDPRSWITFHSSLMRKSKRYLHEHHPASAFLLSPRQWFQPMSFVTGGSSTAVSDEHNSHELFTLNLNNNNEDKEEQHEKNRKKASSSPSFPNEIDEILERERDFALHFWQPPLPSPLTSSNSNDYHQVRFKIITNTMDQNNVNKEEIVIFSISGEISLKSALEYSREKKMQKKTSTVLLIPSSIYSSTVVNIEEIRENAEVVVSVQDPVNVWSLLPYLLSSSMKKLSSSSFVFFGPGFISSSLSKTIDKIFEKITDENFVGCTPISSSSSSTSSSLSSYHHLGQGLEVHQGTKAQLFLDERMTGFSSKDRRTVSSSSMSDFITDTQDGVPLAAVSPFCFGTRVSNLVDFWPSSANMQFDTTGDEENGVQNIIAKQHRSNTQRDQQENGNRHQSFQNKNSKKNNRKRSASSSSDFFINWEHHGDILTTMLNSAGFYFWSSPSTTPTMIVLFDQVQFLTSEKWTPTYGNNDDNEIVEGGLVAVTSEYGMSSTKQIHTPALARLFHLAKLPVAWWSSPARDFLHKVILNNDKKRIKKITKSPPLQPAIIWETFCVPCFGFTNEVMHFVWPLENRIPIRVRHGVECFCFGSPKAMTRSLKRLGMVKAFESRPPPSSLESEEDENENEQLKEKEKEKSSEKINDMIKKRRQKFHAATSTTSTSNNDKNKWIPTKNAKALVQQSSSTSVKKKKLKPRSSSLFKSQKRLAFGESSSSFSSSFSSLSSAAPSLLSFEPIADEGFDENWNKLLYDDNDNDQTDHNLDNNNDEDDEEQHENNNENKNKKKTDQNNKVTTKKNKRKSSLFKRQDDHFIVLILHKDPGSLPSSMWATQTSGLYRTPDLIIARSMFEFTKVPSDWRHKDKIAREVWVPSRFVRWVFEHQDDIIKSSIIRNNNNENDIDDEQQKQKRKRRQRKDLLHQLGDFREDDEENNEDDNKHQKPFFDNNKLVVIGEPIDAYYYDPITVRPLQLPIFSNNILNWKVASNRPQESNLISNDIDKNDDDDGDLSKNYKFFSSFKWEMRKGWEILLKAYFREFRAEDPVSLYISSYLYGDDTRDPNRLMDFVKKIAIEVIKERREREKDELNQKEKDEQELLHHQQNRLNARTRSVLKRNVFPSSGRFSQQHRDSSSSSSEETVMLFKEEIEIAENEKRKQKEQEEKMKRKKQRPNYHHRRDPVLDEEKENKEQQKEDRKLSSTWQSLVPHVEIISERISEQKMVELYRSVDAFVLPTRGEGWGLPVIQAMSMGLPVIATNWSGEVDFLMSSDSEIVSTSRNRKGTEGGNRHDNDDLHHHNRKQIHRQGEICYPIRVEKLEPAIQNPGDEPQKGKDWSVPSLDHLRELMRKVYTFRDEAKKRGAKARSYIVSQFSDEAVAELVARRVEYLMEKEVRGD